MNDLINDYYYYRNNEPAEPKVTTSIFLFTDRSIYRPGQTVYFKGIVLMKNEKEKKDLSEKSMKLLSISVMPITKMLIP